MNLIPSLWFQTFFLICLATTNIIVFQYNPETLTRALNPWLSQPTGYSARADDNAPSLAQPFDPEESFTLILELDAADAMEEGQSVAVLSGIADRISALEMLLYPVNDKGSVLGQAFASLGG